MINFNTSGLSLLINCLNIKLVITVSTAKVAYKNPTLFLSTNTTPTTNPTINNLSPKSVINLKNLSKKSHLVLITNS